MPYLLALTILSGFIESVSEIPSQILDRSDCEWINPDYIFEIEETIDPRLYGEPASEICGIYRIGYCSSFVEDDNWRIVLLYGDKLVVIQENWDSPREWYLYFIPSMLQSSHDGLMLAVYAASTYAEDTDVMIVIPDRDPECIRSQIPFDFNTRRLGSSGMILDREPRYFNVYDESINCYPVNDSCNFTNRSMSADGSVIAFTYKKPALHGWERTTNLVVFDEWDRELWCLALPTSDPKPYITRSGKYLLLPAADMDESSIVCFSSRTGDLVFNQLRDSCITSDVVSSVHDKWWAVRAVASGMFNRSDSNYVYLGTFDDPISSHVVFRDYSESWGTQELLDVSDTGRILIRMGSPPDDVWAPVERLVLLTEAGVPVWISETFVESRGLFHRSLSSDRIWPWESDQSVTISSTGDRIIFTDYRNIYIARIEEL